MRLIDLRQSDEGGLIRRIVPTAANPSVQPSYQGGDVGSPRVKPWSGPAQGRIRLARPQPDGGQDRTGSSLSSWPWPHQFSLARRRRDVLTRARPRTPPAFSGKAPVHRIVVHVRVSFECSERGIEGAHEFSVASDFPISRSRWARRAAIGRSLGHPAPFGFPPRETEFRWKRICCRRRSSSRP